MVATAKTDKTKKVPKNQKYIWTDAELDIVKDNYGQVEMLKLQKMLPNKTLQAIKRKGKAMGIITEETKEVSKYPVDCDMCGKPLPDEELLIGVANHRECWRKWVAEQRRKNPIPVDDDEKEDLL